MIPPEALPPLTEQGVKSLVGRKCKVKRLTNPNKIWRVTIQEVRFVAWNSALVKVGGHSMFGKDRWVPLSSVIWPGKEVDDPLVLAIQKSRFDESQRVTK